jgi:hypothetical protein
MNDPQVENLIRETSKPGAVSWGTTCPFSMGEVVFRKVGFAGLYKVQCTVYAPETRSVVAAVRQHVFYELETQGIPTEIIEFVPTVETKSRRRKFVDQNTSSQSTGKNKMGYELTFNFEIKPFAVHRWFDWSMSTGTVKK